MLGKAFLENTYLREVLGLAAGHWVLLALKEPDARGATDVARAKLWRSGLHS